MFINQPSWCLTKKGICDHLTIQDETDHVGFNIFVCEKDVEKCETHCNKNHLWRCESKVFDVYIHRFLFLFYGISLEL